MNFADAIKVCFNKYADFSGRARRSEFWWFFLFYFVGNIVLGSISSVLGLLFVLATIVPGLAVGARRLHDTNRSGWWQLIGLIPLIGFIVLIVLFAQEGQSGDNQYGPPAK
ncbi:MAG TPA: DUF805 domain-containing protein [Methylophilaceae bacterium]|jgi:uncharacterized membrane protein YhaH (DUF805 family)